MGFELPDGTPRARQWRLRLLVWLNGLRARLTGISFGDQAQFFRLVAVPDFPALALMEDVELALILKERGGTLLLPIAACVSGRRWIGTGFGFRVAQVLGLFAVYLALRRLARRVDVDGMYRVYYGREPTGGRRKPEDVRQM